METFKLLVCIMGTLLSSIVSGTPVCVYKGSFYISDTEIYDGNCNVAYCDKMAQIVYRHGCASSTKMMPPPTTHIRTTLPPPTPQMTTTLPPPTPQMTTTLPIPTAFGCHVNGKVYPAGSHISKGEDRGSNWCYGTYCDSDGNTINWENFNCFPTPSVTPTAVPETNIPETTIPAILSTLLSGMGCYYNGKFYPSNTNLGAPDDRATKYCTKCDENGQIQHWYDFDCFRTQVTQRASTQRASTPPNIVG